MKNAKRIGIESLMVFGIMLFISAIVGALVKLEATGVAMLVSLLLIPSIVGYSAPRLSPKRLLKHVVYLVPIIQILIGMVGMWFFPSEEVKEGQGLQNLLAYSLIILFSLCFIVNVCLDKKWKNQERIRAKYDW